MDLEKARSILEEIKNIGPGQIVYLFNYGEPMLHPRIGEIVAICTEWGIRSKISTNGFRIDSKGPEVMRSGLDVLMIDLDGVSEEAHTTYRVGSDIHALMENIKTMMERIKGDNIETRILLQTILHQRNVNERDKIRAYAREVGIQYIAWKALALDLGVTLGDEAFEETYNNLVVKGGEFDRYAGLLRRNEKLACPFGQMNGVVLSNGDYVVCTHDANAEIVLGNVFEEGYKTLRDHFFNTWRERAGRKALSICDTCSMSTNLGHIEDLEEKNSLEGTVNFSAYDPLLNE